MAPSSDAEKKNNSIRQRHFWRSGAGQLHRWTQPAATRRGHGRSQCIRRQRRLCGNPGFEPRCAELVRRGRRVWWGTDRFAIGAWRPMRRARRRAWSASPVWGGPSASGRLLSCAESSDAQVDLTRPSIVGLTRLAGEIAHSVAIASEIDCIRQFSPKP